MSWSDDSGAQEDQFPRCVPAPRRPQGGSLVSPRTSRRLWRLSIVLTLVIAATDAALGSQVILIGLLIVGPCCALFTAQRACAAQVCALAVVLALLLALPDGIWDTPAQLAFTGAVLMVGIACTWGAGIVESMTKR